MPLVREPDGGGSSLLLQEYGDQGYRGPPEVPDSLMEDLHNVAMRPDDVILCSYPKSGCHWLWEMTRMLLAGTDDVEVVEKENYMMEYQPHDNMAALPSPRIFNTHFLFHQLPQPVQQGQHKIVFVYRNPKDVAVSFYNHHFKFPEYEYNGDFHDYLPNLFMAGKTDFGDYFSYHKQWDHVFQSNPNLKVFRVSYEQLQVDALSHAQRLAAFLGSEADEDAVARIVQACSFNSMRGRKGGQWTQENGEPVMYRKGKVGDWKNWMTVAENEMMDSVCRTKMEGSSFTLQYTI